MHQEFFVVCQRRLRHSPFYSDLSIHFYEFFVSISFQTDSLCAYRRFRRFFVISISGWIGPEHGKHTVTCRMTCNVKFEEKNFHFWNKFMILWPSQMVPRHRSIQHSIKFNYKSLHNRAMNIHAVSMPLRSIYGWSAAFRILFGETERHPLSYMTRRFCDP